MRRKKRPPLHRNERIRPKSMRISQSSCGRGGQEGGAEGERVSAPPRGRRQQGPHFPVECRRAATRSRERDVVDCMARRGEQGEEELPPRGKARR